MYKSNRKKTFLPLLKSLIVTLPLLFKFCDFALVILLFSNEAAVCPYFVILLEFLKLNGRKKKKIEKIA